jgi:signal transduction histidine kinase
MIIPFPIYFLVPSALLMIIIGSYSWLKLRNKESLLFFLLTICQSIWAISTFLMWNGCDADESIVFWDKFLYFFISIVIALLFHFSLEVCQVSKTKKNKILILLSYILAIFFSYLVAAGHLIGGVFRYEWGCHTCAQQPGHDLFLIYILFFVIIALNNLYKTFVEKKFNKELRTKALFVFIAFLVYSFSLIGMLPAYGISVYPFAYLFFPLFTIIITYAITEKNIFISGIATDVLIGFILVLFSTFLFFPDIQIGILVKIIIFILLLLACLLLLKHNHEEVERKNEAEKLNELKSEFISIVSHQLRTPLTAIRGYSGMLKDEDYGVLSKKISSPIDHIHYSSISMINMINGLLSMARIERGTMILEFKKFSIDKMINECIDEVSIKAKEKNLYLKYVKNKVKIPLVNGDVDKIKNAVLNILNNAVLYTLKGGITIKAYKVNLSFRIEIKDTGIGLEKEEIDKLFGSFSRGERGINVNTQGNGLGLYVAKNFIEIHGGKISIFSEGKGKGSTFYIDVPIRSVFPKGREFDLK